MLAIKDGPVQPAIEDSPKKKTKRKNTATFFRKRKQKKELAIEAVHKDMDVRDQWMGLRQRRPQEEGLEKNTGLRT